MLDCVGHVLQQHKNNRIITVTRRCYFTISVQPGPDWKVLLLNSVDHVYFISDNCQVVVRLLAVLLSIRPRLRLIYEGVFINVVDELVADEEVISGTVGVKKPSKRKKR